MSDCTTCVHFHAKGGNLCRRNPPLMMGISQPKLAGMAPVIVGGWPAVVDPKESTCGEHSAAVALDGLTIPGSFGRRPPNG
jgi:hypothetical protein